MTYDHPGARIRVGIVGATPERGWAAMAHISAIRAVPSLTLQAVATHDLRPSGCKDQGRAPLARFAASAYEASSSDIRTGSRRSVSFTDALARRETIEAIRVAACERRASGVRPRP